MSARVGVAVRAAGGVVDRADLVVHAGGVGHLASRGNDRVRRALSQGRPQFQARGHQRQGDGEVEVAAFLYDIGGREIDRGALKASLIK